MVVGGREGGGGSLSRAALPVYRQVQPVEGVERVGQGGVQLQLGQQGEVVRGDVGVGAAGDVVVDEPLAVQRPQQAQNTHVGFREEDVVDHALQTRKHHVITASRAEPRNQTLNRLKCVAQDSDPESDIFLFVYLPAM